MINASQSTVLGKRKAAARAREHLVIRLTSPSTASDWESDGPVASSSKGTLSPTRALKSSAKKRYICEFNGCHKSYSKPSRLEEHKRTHTGQRPYKCNTCGKSYLRDTHLHAHTRSHLPNESRPFACQRDGCDKRFWTAQHQEAHHAWHDGAKPYKCDEPDCDEAFAKHNQLRAHICSSHAPPGTRPYRCDREGCTKSFDTNQHLRTHQKTHETKRYACSNSACMSLSDGQATYFSNWSALQTHIRTFHRPTCPHPSCNGKIFSNAGNLRAHLKLHEEREAEFELDRSGGSDADIEDQGPRKKRRRGGELGRDWKCDVGCEKDFKSKKALQTHTNITHLGRRDFVCPETGCGQAFGYKHLLQRHTAKAHSLPEPPPDDSDHEDHAADSPSDEGEHLSSVAPAEDVFDIDMITGNTYAKEASARVDKAQSLRCPYPFLDGLVHISSAQTHSAAGHCEYVYSRAYDLRRHLAASHDAVLEKRIVDAWVKVEKTRLQVRALR